jgi:uncharacterized membrane protein YeaQ/YmgE (transglycosylase-associated protein family)
MLLSLLLHFWGTRKGETNVDGVSLLAWIIVGAIAGWLAGVVMRSPMGILTDIIVGIIGGFIGGWLLSLLGVGAGVSGLNLGSILTAFIGAVILIAVVRAIRGSGPVVR